MTISHQGALGLELENDEGTMLVEFAVGDDGAFSVGSSPHAGLRIQRQGVAPIEFYVQREDDALWLVPAYASAELRLDAQRVTGRRELRGRSLLEITNELLVIRVHEPHELEAVRAQQQDDRTHTRIYTKAPQYIERIPTENDATRVAMQPPRRSNHPIAFYPTEAVPVVAPPPETALPVLSSELEALPAPVAPAPDPAPPVVSSTPEAPPPVASPKPQAAPPPVSAKPEDDVPLWQKTVEIPRFHAKTWMGDRDVAPQRDRTVLDMPVAEPAQPVPAKPAPKPAAKAPRAAGKTRVPFAPLLGKLGLLAKRRPVPVAIGALATALVGSLALATLARAQRPAASKPRPQTVMPASETLLAKAQPAAPAATSVPSVRVHSSKTPSPQASSSVPKRKQAGPIDPELAEATEHLVAGRDSQAKAAYARLARRSPDEPAYAVAARLLERMAACTDPTTRLQVSCPKVKR